MKVGRQAKIIELIRNYDVETQEDLADLLEKSGFTVTQATISRDIRDLKLTKVPAGNGRMKYGIMQQQDQDLFEKYVRVFRDGYAAMDHAGNLLVVKTAPGMAMAVGAALDQLHLPGVLGCIAGDDTVMCAVRTEEETTAAMNRLKKLLSD